MILLGEIKVAELLSISFMNIPTPEI